MTDPYFFGFGSLVNAKTHIYEDTHTARLRGWRRCWRHTTMRQMAFLSVEAADASIDGLIAKVPDADWAALDLRETGYIRAPLAPTDLIHDAGQTHVEMYQVDPNITVPGVQKASILLSYLDVVVQGYLQVYGEDGVQRFFDTTAGWDCPILNDRSAPQYPRSQTLTAHETALVDHHIAQLAT